MSFVIKHDLLPSDLSEVWLIDIEKMTKRMMITITSHLKAILEGEWIFSFDPRKEGAFMNARRTTEKYPKRLDLNVPPTDAHSFIDSVHKRSDRLYEVVRHERHDEGPAIFISTYDMETGTCVDAHMLIHSGFRCYEVTLTSRYLFCRDTTDRGFDFLVIDRGCLGCPILPAVPNEADYTTVEEREYEDVLWSICCTSSYPEEVNMGEVDVAPYHGFIIRPISGCDLVLQPWYASSKRWGEALVLSIGVRTLPIAVHSSDGRVAILFKDDTLLLFDTERKTGRLVKLS